MGLAGGEPRDGVHPSSEYHETSQDVKWRNDATTPSAQRTSPMTFFIGQRDASSAASSASTDRTIADSDMGVQSLNSNVDSLHVRPAKGASPPKEQEDNSSTCQAPPTSLTHTPLPRLGTSTTSAASSPPRSPTRFLFRSASGRHINLNDPSTRYSSPALESQPTSTPKSVSVRSFRLYDDESGCEDTDSQAVVSGEEEDEEEHEILEEEDAAGKADYNHLYDFNTLNSQLIMPSISMPSRRPFTTRGKAFGTLKVMVVGRTGAGKTSFIKSLLQHCEDIVHVETSQLLSTRPSQVEDRSRELNPRISQREVRFSQVNASTRPVPAWRNERHEAHQSQSSSAQSDVALDRNVCFVDTPGYDPDTLDPHNNEITSNLENLLRRNLSWTSMDDLDVLNLFSGSGGSQVDLILFLVPGNELDNDLTVPEVGLLERLCQLTNVLPVLSKADLCAVEDRKARLTAILNTTSAQHKSKSLGDLVDKGISENAGERVFAVSSAPSADDDNMDASLLMSSEYLAPLQASDLKYLSDSLFAPSTASRLQYLSANKFNQWRKAERRVLDNTPAGELSNLPGKGSVSGFPAGSTILNLPQPSSMTSESSPSFARPLNLPQIPDIPRGIASPSTIANLSTNVQRERHLAQAHLAKWAADLQRALQSERTRYAQITQAERTAWLNERLEECVSAESHNPGFRKKQHSIRVDRSDPLGLLAWHNSIRNNGVVLVQVLGGAGIVGAVTVWAIRTWDVEGLTLGSAEGWWRNLFWS